MRNVTIIVLSLLFLPAFFGCQKDESKTMLNDNIAPNELQALSASEYTLALENKDQTFESFEWTKPDFGFQAAITYTLQADVADSGFNNPLELVQTDNLTVASVTQGTFNQKMLDAGYEPDVAYDMDFRVSSVVNPNVDPVYSTVQTATVTPYATTFPPIYMIGDAVGGWDTNLAVAMHSTAPNVYTTINE
ncbi:MAG TPA: SusE domain-containing protein, partial [Bacteroidales bacterium]|nr:SusE domain-containing protein [Bacteroidales bacterium]